MDERELLRTVPLFSELNDDAITSLGRLAAPRKYPKDTVVFFENEEGDSLFMIMDGRIKVTILGDDGREIILTMLGEGDLFGEIAFFTEEGQRSASVRAMSDGQVLVLRRNFLKELTRDNPEAGFQILNNMGRVMAHRIMDLNHALLAARGAQR